MHCQAWKFECHWLSQCNVKYSSTWRFTGKASGTQSGKKLRQSASLTRNCMVPKRYFGVDLQALSKSPRIAGSVWGERRCRNLIFQRLLFPDRCALLESSEMFDRTPIPENYRRSPNPYWTRIDEVLYRSLVLRALRRRRKIVRIASPVELPEKGLVA